MKIEELRRFTGGADDESLAAESINMVLRACAIVSLLEHDARRVMFDRLFELLRADYADTPEGDVVRSFAYLCRGSQNGSGKAH